MSGSEERNRLEQLWEGDFGDDYVDRNLDASQGRGHFWKRALGSIDARTAMEVGCNVGGNLTWVAEVLGAQNVAGVDVNERALEKLRENVPGVEAKVASGRDLPFEDGSFDLVFTMGVLIHQDPADVGDLMSEVVRCSRRYVICGEYFAEELTEVPYRGQEGALWKQDYGALYRRLFPDLEQVERGFLTEDDGRWDDLTYWIFRKPSAS